MNILIGSLNVKWFQIGLGFVLLFLMSGCSVRNSLADAPGVAVRQHLYIIEIQGGPIDHDTGKTLLLQTPEQAGAWR